MIGENIRKAREQLHLTQTELAEKVGISKQSLYKYEKGIVTNIPSDKVEKIANALNTTPEHIMGWDLIDTFFEPLPEYQQKQVDVIKSIYAAIDPEGAKKKEEQDEIIDSYLHAHLIDDEELAIVNKLRKLDDIDLGKIIERIDILLENEKYKKVKK